MIPTFRRGAALWLAPALLALTACGAPTLVRDVDGLILPEERGHLSNLRQLTFGGTNAEAYWAYDDSQLILQVTQSHLEDGTECDQIFRLDVWSVSITNADALQ